MRNRVKIGRKFELECIPFLDSLFDRVEHKPKKGFDFIVWKNGRKFTVEAKIRRDGKTKQNPNLTESEADVDFLVTKKRGEIKLYDKDYIKKNISILKTRRGFQNVGMDVEDVKKLKDYQVHPNQPYWEVIKKILNGETQIEKPEAVKSDLCSSYKSLNNQEMKGGSK